MVSLSQCSLPGMVVQLAELVRGVRQHRLMLLSLCSTTLCSQVVYLSPEQTPRQSLLKDQGLVRVTSKKSAVPSSVEAASPSPHSTTRRTTPAPPSPINVGPAQRSGKAICDPPLEETFSDLHVGDSMAGMAQTPPQELGSQHSDEAQQTRGSQQQVPQRKPAQALGEGQGKGLQQGKGLNQVQAGAGQVHGQVGARGSEQGQGPARVQEEVPDLRALEDACMKVLVAGSGGPDVAGAVGVMKISAVHSYFTESGVWKVEPESAIAMEEGNRSTAQEIKHFAAALRHQYTGECLFLQNDLLGAAIKHSMSLSKLYSLPTHLPSRISRELRTLIIHGMFQALGCRARTLGMLGERVASYGMKMVALDFFQRMYRDCLMMIRIDPEGSFGYVMGALSLSNAHVVRGEPGDKSWQHAFLELLQKAETTCTDEGPLTLRAFWQRLIEKEEYPRQVPQNSLAGVAARRQVRWGLEAGADAAVLPLLAEVRHFTSLVQFELLSPILVTSSTVPKPFIQPAELYSRRPYTGRLASWDDSDVMRHVEIQRSKASTLYELAATLGPHGLFNERPCSRPGCLGGMTTNPGHCALQPWSEETRSLVSSQNVAVARRCLELGTTDAREGRILEAAMWYTRGLVVLLPNGCVFALQHPETIRKCMVLKSCMHGVAVWRV